MSRICERDLLSIMNYIQPQNETQSFKVLNPCSFQENEAGPEGFEPSISGSEGQRLNPYWATGPQKRLVHKRLKVFRKSLKIVKGFIVFDVVEGR